MSVHDEMGGGSNVTSKYCPDNLKAFEEQLEKRESLKDYIAKTEKKPATKLLLKEEHDLTTGEKTIGGMKTAKREFDFRAKDTQVGGSHYKLLAIQPFEYAMKNNFNAGQFGVLKYITRYKLKNGIEDLRKAKHFLELLAEEEYPNEKL